jgi:hypothetical protein
MEARLHVFESLATIGCVPLISSNHNKKSTHYFHFSNYSFQPGYNLVLSGREKPFSFGADRDILARFAMPSREKNILPRRLEPAYR